ncbi:MAG: mechanosensitive ion channel [Acidobacteriota bacterium]|nr:mechanosensitive ion channel [Acidobacteriota bacterium]
MRTADTNRGFAVFVAAGATGLGGVIPWIPRDVEKFMERPFFHVGALAVTPWFLVKALVYLLIVGAIAGATRRFLLRKVLPRTSMGSGQQDVFSRWVQYFVFSVGLIIGLQTSGLDLSSLLVVGGALGVGIGFGLQNVANNFISGLILLIEQPIRVGQIVEVGGLLGPVVRIGARSTWVHTGTNAVIIVPNSEFVSTRVTNWGAGDPRVLVKVKIGVGYGSDPNHVREILLDIARAHPQAITDPAPAVLFQEFGDSSLNFELFVWFPGTVMQAGGFRSALNFAIFEAMKGNNIEIPFPQRDIHIRSTESAPALSQPK